MRVALFVAVVAAHLILLLFFPLLWRRASSGHEEEPASLPIFLPPRVAVTPELQQRPGGRAGPRTRRRRSEPSEAHSPDLQQPQPESTPTPPDWHAQAEELAQLSAQHIVEAEDIAKRQANALTAPFKPLAPDRIRGPEFGWSAATHRIAPLPGGGLVYTLNDHCQLLVFPMPFIGCAVGKIEANGDLFKYMHPPVKFGDWDKREADP